MTGTVAIDHAGIAVERVFREANGQAVATLIRIFGDITLAEDAVQDAFVVASDRWRREGIPPNPWGPRYSAGDDRRDRPAPRELSPVRTASQRCPSSSVFTTSSATGWRSLASRRATLAERASISRDVPFVIGQPPEVVGSDLSAVADAIVDIDEPRR